MNLLQHYIQNKQVVKQKLSLNFNKLYKIKSIKKQVEIFNILKNKHPTHSQRVWIVGFLYYVGYSPEEIIDIIRSYNCWENFSGVITKYQVYSVIKCIKKRK